MKKKTKKKKRKVKKNKTKSKKISFKKKKLVTSKEKIKDNNLIKIKSDWQKKHWLVKNNMTKNITTL